MRLSYRASLYASFLVTVAVPILLSFALFQTFLKRTAQSEFHSQAERVARGVTEELTRRSDSLLRLAEVYSADQRIAAAVADRNRGALMERLAELYRYSNLDLLEVGDSSGHVLAKAHRPQEHGESKSSQLIIRNALEGRQDADIEYGASGIALRAVAPIQAVRGASAGTLMTGVLLNRDFLDIYKTITGFDIAFFERGTLIASTSPRALQVTTDFPHAVSRDGARLTGTVFALHGEEMWGVSNPLYHRNGSFFGSILLWRERAAVLKPLRANQLIVTFSFLVTCAFAFLLAVSLSRSFSSPLKRMLTVIDRVSKGEMDAEIPNLRWDEFQELSRHFKSMVSELKKSQDKIMRTQQQLIVAAKFAILGQVTAELAHEVRNPLNSMEITLRLLREEVGDAALAPPGIIEKIECVHSEIKRLDQTIRDFVEAGGSLVLKKTRSDLAEEIRAVLALAAPQVEMLGIWIELDLETGLHAEVDPNRFRQALLNLLLNACQSMKPGGKLAIAGSRSGDRVVIAVRDTGVGMGAEERARLFDFPFTTKPGGTGCGLSSVMRIVQAHAGDFDIESEEGVGTTVRISLPAYREGGNV
ncbi:MAG: HAMP domain-containing protein [Candidatus Aureabacteria bacterium]|nr:HAMP domain-containing protein [Candidatus Auribacterota bacterium]NLW93473.1 HAMP domain-containing protein [Chlamydiota bacterium]HQM52333.1 ATP-binding protein [bacterium]